MVEEAFVEKRSHLKLVRRWERLEWSVYQISAIGMGRAKLRQSSAIGRSSYSWGSNVLQSRTAPHDMDVS